MATDSRAALQKNIQAAAKAEGAPVILAAVLEYLSTEVLELSGENTKDNKKRRIIHSAPMAAMSDEELGARSLGKLMAGVTIAHGGVVPYIHSALLPKKAVGRPPSRYVDCLGFCPKPAQSTCTKLAC
ncbi:hypothetical protein VPH35_034639 [Triticum aestivum]|uniref:Histone H2A n=1 Tax=Aegilops tauschii TaxID=37682 RepID=M8B9C5_AEGTA